MSPDPSIGNTSTGNPSADPAAADNSGADRREYFRVEDRALLRYCVVSAEVATAAPAESHFDDSDLFWVMRELRNIDRENHNVLRTIAEQSRDLGQYLRGINRKIELIAGALLARDPDHAGIAAQEISLSEGGLSLLVDPKLEVGSTLALELTLLPEQIGIVCYGEVIANRDEPPQRNVVQFVRLRDADRQLIARHIFQVQIAARRQQVAATAAHAEEPESD
ncbi:MAG: PilZ domain-containing protein [Spongiibacteraceae bacterium]